MVWRLDNVVVGGEIINKQKNSVQGYLLLRDREEPVILQLTGNCGPELAGRHLRFGVRGKTPGKAAAEEWGDFVSQQIGPTGRMTLEPGPQTQDVGVGPTAPGGGHLHLEWFSQNGRVILNLNDPLITFVEDGAAGHAATPADLPWHLESPLAELAPGEPAHWEVEFAKWDAMFSGEKDAPICTLFDPPLKLYPAERLDDPQVAQALDLLLARLALHGIALIMCEHYTPREAYRLLIERILPEEHVYPHMPGLGFVYHYMTAEFCPRCEAELQ